MLAGLASIYLRFSQKIKVQQCIPTRADPVVCFWGMSQCLEKRWYVISHENVWQLSYYIKWNPLTNNPRKVGLLLGCPHFMKIHHEIMRTYVYIYIYADENIYIFIIIIPDTTDCCVYNIYIYTYTYTNICVLSMCKCSTTNKDGVS